MSKVVNAVNNNINTNKGYELVNKIYKDAFNISLNLNNNVISNLVQVNDNSISLNSSSSYYKMIVGNYYGALADKQSDAGYQFIPFINSSGNNDAGMKRARTIHKENFKTGDILIYKNKQKKASDTKYETESGYYYLIYIEENTPITKNNKSYSGFIGIDNNGNVKNIKDAGFITVRSVNEKAQSYYNDDIVNDFQTILAKDLYVILRPSLGEKIK